MAVPAPVPTVITYDELCQIRQRITKRGFKEVHASDDPYDDEVSFCSPEINGFTVKVSTACSREKTEACCAPSLFPGMQIVSGSSEPIMGCVRIFDARTGAEVYSSVVYRTPTFVEDLLKKAWLVWLRVRRPPNCPECKTRMKIFRRQVNGQTWWWCDRKAAHSNGEPIWRPWDVMLSGEERALARAIRAERAAIKKAIA